MMEYNIFKETVAKRICDYLPPIFNSYYGTVESITKVNEKKDALTLKTDDIHKGMAMPVIYLDEMYELFQSSEDMEDVLQCASEIIVNFAGTFEDIDVFTNIESQMENIIPNLLNTVLNRELLENVPHMEVMDMSVIYRIIRSSSMGGYDSCIITTDILKELGVDKAQLHQIAMKNMKRLLPLEISRISREDDGSRNNQDIPYTFTFVSSKQRLFGASYMIFEDVMNDICRDLKTNRLFIIPFNINEICITSAEDIYLEKLVEILYQSNREEISPKDYLSNNIYCFDKKRGSLSKVAAYDKKIGLN